MSKGYIQRTEQSINEKNDYVFEGYVHTKDKRIAYELEQRGGKVIEIETPQSVSYFILDYLLYNAIATSEGLKLEYATPIKKMMTDLRNVIYRDIINNGSSDAERHHKHIILETLTLAYHDLLLNNFMLTPSGILNEELFDDLGFTKNMKIKEILDNISLKIYGRRIDSKSPPKHIIHINTIYTISARGCKYESHFEVNIEVKKEQVESNIAYINGEYRVSNIYDELRKVRSYVDLSNFDNESKAFIDEHLEPITALYINLRNEGGKIPVLPKEFFKDDVYANNRTY